jgi:hypothetical protein
MIDANHKVLSIAGQFLIPSSTAGLLYYHQKLGTNTALVCGQCCYQPDDLKPATSAVEDETNR